MARLRLSLYTALTLVSLSSVLLSTSVKADETVTTTVERHVIVTPAPAAKEVIVTPTGYADCFTVAAGWVRDNWVPEHKVCRYEKQAEGVAWIEGYWACNKATNSGTCTNWEWKPAHWEKTLEVY